MTSHYTDHPGQALRDDHGRFLMVPNPPNGWLFVNDSPEVRALAVPVTQAQLRRAKNGCYAAIRVEVRGA